MISVKKKRLLTKNTKIDKRGPMVKKPSAFLCPLFMSGLRKFHRLPAEQGDLCGLGAMGFLRLVSVNVASYCVLPVKARKIKRAFGLNGLFSVPVFRLWQH